MYKFIKLYLNTLRGLHVCLSVRGAAGWRIAHT